MTQSMRLSTHPYDATLAARANAAGSAWRQATRARSGGGPAGFLTTLRDALRRLHRPRLYRIDQLPLELLRDVDPALHDAISARFNGWSSLDARNRAPFY